MLKGGHCRQCLNIYRIQKLKRDDNGEEKSSISVLMGCTFSLKRGACFFCYWRAILSTIISLVISFIFKNLATLAKEKAKENILIRKSTFFRKWGSLFTSQLQHHLHNSSVLEFKYLLKSNLRFFWSCFECTLI